MPEVYERRQVLRDVAVAVRFAVCWFGGMAWALDHGWYPFSRALYVLAGLWTAALLAAGKRRQRELYFLTFLGYPVAWGVVGPSFGLYEELLLVPLLLAAYRVSSSGRLALRWALPASLLVLALVTVQAAGLDALATAPYRGTAAALELDHVDVSQLLFQEAIMAAFVLLGRAEHQRHQAMAMLAARNDELERLRRIEAGQVVVAERTRIARELHDVVAHHVSAIVIRAQAADRVADRRPDEPREAVRWIASAGQDALTSMRRVVEVLHSPTHPDVPVDSAATASVMTGPGSQRLRPAQLVTTAHTPAAGLDELTDIVARVTGAGVPVSLAVEELPALPAHVELAALRIVQEALTNVLLHTRASRATVAVTCQDGWLWVCIDDDGPPAPATPAADHSGGRDDPGRHGNGVPGMHARAVLCGGTLRVDEKGPLGGWRVQACLPLEPSPRDHPPDRPRVSPPKRASPADGMAATAAAHVVTTT